MDDDDDLIDGNNSDADYNQATGGSGSAYVQNQTPYDIADNGAVTTTPTSTTTTPPAWQTAITNLGTQAATNLLNTATGVSPTTATATPAAAAAAAAPLSTTTKLIIGGIIAAIVAFLLLGRK